MPYPNQQDPTTGAIPVFIATGAGGPVTPATGLASVVITGGTAVKVAQGPIRGGYLFNPLNAAAQGIGTAENLYVDPVNAPGSTDAAGNGTTTIAAPGATIALLPLAAGAQYRVNAATSGHTFTVVLV
jgi:hypothetical protein